MKLFPFENITIESPLSPTDVENTIGNNISWNTELSINSRKKSFRDFEGSVTDRAFKVKRLLKIGYSAFIPIVSGIISEDANGSRIELKLRLHKIINIFLIVMTLFMGSIYVTIWIQELNHQSEMINYNGTMKEILDAKQYAKFKKISQPNQTDWVGILMFAMPYVVTTIFFNLEAKLAKDNLKMLLNVKDEV